MTDSVDRYIEEFALFYEDLGLPRIAGRILALLLVCDPPSRTAAQLTDELGASKASVSQMTRLLITVGFIERFGVRGSRAAHFRVRDDGFEAMFTQQIVALTALGPMAARGVELVGPGDRADRLRKLRALLRFFEEAMPEMLERWRVERGTRIADES
ncbi:MAG: MarR family transcriptional regulator [Myxococcota bacterium]